MAISTAKLQSARRSTGICEVLTDEKNYDKATAEARLKTEKDTAPSMPCGVEMDDGQGKSKVNLIRITAKQGQAIPENNEHDK